MEKPVICKVKGLFNFDAKSSDEISFKKDDILDIIAIETTMWWTARNQDGFVGHIPANYVRLMESIKEPFQSSQEKTPEATNCESFKPAAKEKRSEDETEYVIAKFSFKRRTEKELSLRKGDVIDVIQKADNGWWEGKLGNRIGWFPANCVAAENFNVGSAHGVDSPAILHRVKCKYTFLAQDPDDLSCEVGDILDVIDKAEPYPGWRLMRNQDGIEGLVPINYMTILDTDIEPAVDEIESASASSAKEKRRDDETETVIARFSYKGSEGDELSFKKGDVIDVIRKASDGWWKGKLGERIGLFPANYVTEYSVHEFGPGAMHKVKCKLNFKAEEPDELSCEKGEFLYLIKPEDEPGSRWLMRNQDGIEGLVPLSHVTILDTDIEPAVDEIESASASSAKGESGLEALPVPKPKKPKGFISSARQFLQKLSRKQKKKSKDYSVRSNSSVLLASSSTSSSSKDETKQPKQSTVPREILARGPLALRAYLNALSEGMTFTKRVPLMLIGQSRSGKTSLKKSLKGQAFNRNEASTVGVDVDPSHFKVSTEIWKTGQKNQESNFDTAFSYEHQAAQLIAGSLMAEKQMSEESPRSVTVEKQMPEESPSLVTAVTGDLTEESESGSSVNSSSFPASDSLSLKEDPTAKEDDLKSGQSKMTFPNISYSSASACKFPLKDSEPTDASAEDVASSSKWDKPGTSKVPDEVATLVEKLLHEDRKEKDENDVYSVLWDFGGQSVYYVTHPLFLTPRAIYLLVYDLSRSPRDKADPLARQGMFRKFEDNCSLKTNLDYLDFWMTSVASLASEGSTHQVCPNTLPLPEKLPPVFLVCTHGDEPHGGMDSRTLASEIFDCLQNKPYSAHLFERVFVVDNTKSGGETECPEVLRLRQEILAVTKELPQMKEAIPIKWLQYEKELQVMKEDGIRWISLEQAKQIASKVCRIVEDQEILTLLNFLHDQRILIHFDDTPELNRLVVLDPQWLIDVFKKVITVKPYDHEEREFKELWRKLEKTGIVQEELLKHVWSPLVDEQETSESLIAIMEKFSLMCLWPLSEASCGKQYLVPSMLMSHPPQGIMNLLESVQIPSLFLKFESGQIPPSLFPRLVLQFFQWCTNEFPNSLDPQLFHNFARFYISPDEGCSVVLLCHPSAVEVVVLRENHTTDRDEDSQSMVSLSSDDPNQRTFEVARAVRRQLVMMLDCMKDEFCWLKNMRYEVSFLCPVCSQGGTVNYCRTHHVLGCQQRECLHLWPESELCKYSQAVVCRESADAVETRIQVKRFAPWFIHSDAAEKKPKDEGNGSGLPLTQAPDMERDENKTLALPCAVQDALQSQSCDAKDVVVRLQEDLQLEEAASSLENTEPRTKMMIRCLAREAKCSSRLDVVTHLRKVTPAGTTGPLLHENLDVRNIPFQQSRELSVNLCGGNEWMTVAERLGLKPAEIRFLERRYVNPFEAALQHCRNQRYLNVGQLYDVLVDCDLPVFADLL